MPKRLKPTAPIAADAILVGDPGRAMLLAQELIEGPKMSNHARGLWGYSGESVAGPHLTVQATGMGGPSAAVVLVDLAKLGVRRAIRVGTATAVVPEARLGDLLVVERAIAVGGSAAGFGLGGGEAAEPDPGLTAGLGAALAGEAQAAAIASLDTIRIAETGAPAGALAVDMQTVAVLAGGAGLGLATAAVLIVAEAGGGTIADELLETKAKEAGRAALKALSNPQVES